MIVEMSVEDDNLVRNPVWAAEMSIAFYFIVKITLVPPSHRRRPLTCEKLIVI